MPAALRFAKLGNGGRVSINSDVLDLLANGLSVRDVLEELPDLEESDIPACLRFASRRFDHSVLAARVLAARAVRQVRGRVLMPNLILD